MINIRLIVSFALSILFITFCNNKNGVKKSYYSNGSIKEIGKVVDNKKDSLWTYYNKEGIKIREEFYENGKLNGKAYSWYDNGLIYTEAEYRENLQIREFKVYYDNGQLNSVSNKNEEGVLHGESTIWYENGELRQIRYFKNGIMDSTWQEYNAEGQIINSKSYKNGLKDGVWLQFNEVGDTLINELYKNDSLLSTR